MNIVGSSGVEQGKSLKLSKNSKNLTISDVSTIAEFFPEQKQCCNDIFCTAH